MGVDLSGFDMVANAVDEAVEAEHEEQERVYLGASAIGDGGMGDPCERRLWYGFRWAFHSEKFSGRMLRLFRNGHEKEAIIINDLRRAGMVVEDRDPATGEQWSYRAFGEHYRCHPDGFVTGVPGAPKKRHALEVKTHKASSFKEVKKHGVEVAKPEHVVQMTEEMDFGGTDRALYVALNKDTEELYTERVRLDPAKAARLRAKAERIIFDDTPAPRLKDDPESWPCRVCRLKDGCHGATPARRNCRTCLHVTPLKTGSAAWRCEMHGTELTVEDQRAGCPHHRYLPALIKGEVVEVNEAEELITYRLADGATWTDAGQQMEGAA